MLDRPADRDLPDDVVNPGEVVEPEMEPFEAPTPLDVVGVDGRPAQGEAGDRRTEDEDAAAEQDVAGPLSLPTHIPSRHTGRNGRQGRDGDNPGLDRISGRIPHHIPPRNRGGTSCPK